MEIDDGLSETNVEDVLTPPPFDSTEALKEGALKRSEYFNRNRLTSHRGGLNHTRLV